METFPELSVDLVDALDEAYPPHSSYDLTSQPLENIRARAAQRCLIDRLRALQKEAQDDSLLGSNRG